MLDLVTQAPYLAGPASFGVRASRGAYEAPEHVRLISDAFRRTALTPAGRLMVIAPPRHSKSTTISHYGAAWYLTLFPQNRIVFGTHTAGFAGKWGGRVRRTIEAEGAVTGARTAHRRKEQDWMTSLGGGMRSVGARKGSGATGEGGDLIIVDDTVASQQEALSETVQQATWEWWQADITTRKQTPNTSIVVIGTRWSERDLMGRLLQAYDDGPNSEGYEPWEVLYLPAIYDGRDWTGDRDFDDLLGRDVGQALWPGRWTIDFLRDEERKKAYWFPALFQGRPQPLEGGLLKQTWWNYWRADLRAYDDTPENVEADTALSNVVVGTGPTATVKRPIVLPRIVLVYGSVDTNALADMKQIKLGRQRSDVAVHLWGLGIDGNHYLLDREYGMFDIAETAAAVHRIRARLAPSEPLAQLLGIYDLVCACSWLIEEKANGPAVMEQLRRKDVKVIGITPTEGKVSRVVGAGATEQQRHGRATAFADDLKAGRLFLPHPAMAIEVKPADPKHKAETYEYTWAIDLRQNLAKFPRGGTDDTDAASQAWAKLAVATWKTERKEKRDQEDIESELRKYAGLKKGAALPTSTVELRALRDKQLIDAIERRNLRQYEPKNQRGVARRGPRRRRF